MDLIVVLYSQAIQEIQPVIAEINLGQNKVTPVSCYMCQH
jgi:hypothetical protein